MKRLHYFVLHGALPILLVLSAPGGASADPVLIGLREFDHFIESGGEIRSDDGTAELHSDSNRADQYHSKVGKLTDRFNLNNQDEEAVFTMQILRLLILAGYDATSDHHLGFIDRLPPPYEEYHSMTVWQMEREFKKERIDRQPAFADKFDEMYTRLEKFVVTKAKERRDWHMDHH